MRRGLITFSVFVLAGAAVNVAVAWASAVFVDVELVGHNQEVHQESVDGLYVVHRYRAPLAERVLHSGPVGYWHLEKVHTEDCLTRWGRGYLLEQESERPIRLDKDKYRSVDARGWPFLSLWYGARQSVYGRYPAEVSYGITVGQSRRTPNNLWENTLNIRALPWHPIWSGFVLNTISYAVSLWLFAAGVLAVCRVVRLRRGLCPSCAYPIGESTVCSECGMPLPHRAVA